MFPIDLLPFIYGTFLSHSKPFAGITMYIESILGSENISNLLILHCIFGKCTTLSNNGTGFADMENGGEIQ